MEDNDKEIVQTLKNHKVEYFEPIIAIIVITGVILGGIIGYIASHKDSECAFFGGILGFIFGIFLLIFIFPITAHTTDTINYIEYKVTISDEVNFNEFKDKYEILGQEGKIYTIRERNKVEE